MADSKVTALTELTAVEASDLLYVVDDPGGSPIGKKATVANVLAMNPSIPACIDQDAYEHASCVAYYRPISVGPAGEVNAAASYAQKAFWLPCYVPRSRKVREIRTYCWTGEEGAYLRAGLYNCTNELRPTTLIEEYGTLSGATSGIKSTLGTRVLGPGFFMLCLWASNHGTVRWTKPGSLSDNGFGATLTSGVTWGAWRLQTETADYSAGLPATVVGTAIYDASTTGFLTAVIRYEVP